MTAPGSGQVLYRLPPRPVLLDWIWAGASAGLVLGLAELAVAVPGGSALEPRLAALVLAIDSAIVALGSFLVGLILRSSSVRVSRSGLVGAVVGPLLFAAISGRVSSGLAAGSIPAAFEISGLMTAALLATAAGLVTARLADGLERRGVVCSVLYVWGGVSLTLATSERLVHESRFLGKTGVFIALGLVVGVAIGAWVAVEIARRRESRSAQNFGWLLSWFVIASICAAALPLALPWIFYDPDVPEIGIGPPNFLIAVLPDPYLSSASRAYQFQVITPTLDRLASEGAAYEVPFGATPAAAPAILTDPRGGSVMAQLTHVGYATAAFLADVGTPPELAAAEVDARPGVRPMLEGSLAWLTAAPLLTGPALPLLGALGLDTQARDADYLAERAKAWLLNWRMTRSGAPFAVFIDFRNAAASRPRDDLTERSDAHIADLLELLLTLGVEESTLVVVLSERESMDGVRGRAAQVVVRAPKNWPRPKSSMQAGLLSGGRLGGYLIESSQNNGEIPATSPDLP